MPSEYVIQRFEKTSVVEYMYEVIGEVCKDFTIVDDKTFYLDTDKGDDVVMSVMLKSTGDEFFVDIYINTNKLLPTMNMRTASHRHSLTVMPTQLIQMNTIYTRLCAIARHLKQHSSITIERVSVEQYFGDIVA